MRITYRLAFVALTLASSLGFIVHDMPNQEPVEDASKISGRDDPEGMPKQESVEDTSTVSGRDDAGNYIMYPKDINNQTQNKAIQTLLESLNPSRIYISSSDYNTVTWFWSVTITPEDADKLRAALVAGLVQLNPNSEYNPLIDYSPRSQLPSNESTKYDERSHFIKRDGQVVNSHGVAPEMAFISWPDKKQRGIDFVYDDSAGAGITVYIVDSGAGLANMEFSRYIVANSRYIQAPGEKPNDGQENDVQFHGTGMLAKVAGWKHGVAKRCKPVTVRVQHQSDPGEYLDGVRKVYDDWLPTYQANENTATAVMNLSWGFTRAGLAQSGYPGFIGDYWIGELGQVFQKCIAIGILPITPSGNSPFNQQPVNQYPQLFAYRNDGSPPSVPDMMVVGGVTVDGDRWGNSAVDVLGNPQVIRLYVPSSNINVPAPNGSWRNPYEVHGVSYAMVAAATVSGLAAYFLGLSSLSDITITNDPVQRVKNLKDELEVGSAVWNCQDPETCLPGTPLPGFQNGDEVPCADANTNSGSTVVAIPNCFITTVAPIPSLGINPADTICSCTGDEVAGIGSGTFSGTTYSWCETGGLPSDVPTEVTVPAPDPTLQPTKTTGPKQSCSVQWEFGYKGVILGQQCFCNIGPTPKPTIVDAAYTCPTIPPSKKRGSLKSSNGSL